MAQARAANDDLAAAIARVRQADAQVKIAGAPLLPSLDAGFDASRQRQKPGITAVPGTKPVTYNQFDALLSASYEVDFWGQNRAARDSARFAATASRYDRATVELSITTGVAVTYFQLIALHDRLNVAEQDLATARQVLRGLSLQASAGIATALDVAQQETTVAVLNASIPPLRQQLRQSVHALALLVGKNPEDLPVPSGTLAQITEPLVQPGLPSELLARRPDIAEAEAELMAANADIAAARAAFFPSIDLTADGGFASTALSSLITPASRVFAVTGAVTQQVFAGGALTGRYSLAQGRYQELLAGYHKTVIGAFGNVEDALVAFRETSEQYERQDEAVHKARRAYEMTETQLHAGTINVLTVFNTQSALFTAEDALVQVRFARLQALVQLYGALGGGWQRS